MAGRTLTATIHRHLNVKRGLAAQVRNSNYVLDWHTSPVEYCRVKPASQIQERQFSLSICCLTLPQNETLYVFQTPSDLVRSYDLKTSGTKQPLVVSRCANYSPLLSYCISSSYLKGTNGTGQRYLHTSPIVGRDESKVEETLEAIKDTIKKAEPPKPVADGSQTSSSPDATSVVTTGIVTPPKKSLREKIVAEIKHYYHGFRLLFIDIRVCARLIWQVLNGKSLMRREQKQLVRTTADMFRLVPFLVFIIVPFAEFLLPVVLKLFPGMLPSTFQEADKEKEKLRKTLKMKLEMAKFLQDTIEETALQRPDASGESVHEFVGFMEKIRTSGVQTSNEDILKFSKLFEDEITLDNLNYRQLSALCKLVEVPSVGTSYFLRFQLEMKLRQLEADDKVIQKEGINSMEIWELQEACRQRGMRSFGVPESRLKLQMAQWLDLHLNHKIPASLLLLSRTLYLPEDLSTEDQLKATISALPDSTAEEAKVKILEVSGDRVDNKSKLEIIKQEEEMIQQEKAELEKLHREAELKKAKALESKARIEAAAAQKEAAMDLTEQPVSPEAPSAFAATEVPVKEILVDKAAELDAHEKEEIDSKDLEEIENLLEHVADKKMEMTKEFEELEALKEDFSEYKENLGELKGVMEQSGASLTGLQESKSAQRLSRKVSKMIEQIGTAVSDLGAQKAALLDDIKAKEGQVMEITALEKSEATRKQILDQISEEKHNLITITELLNSIQTLQKIPDSTKFEKIAKMLDANHDGVIEYKEAMKLIDLLGSENVKLNAEQLAEIMLILKKEKELDEEEKRIKKLQQQQTSTTTKTLSDAVSQETGKDPKQL